MMQLTTLRERLEQGFAMPGGRQKARTPLRPEPHPILLDLDALDVMSDLDPGMVDWTEHRSASIGVGS